MAPSRQKREVDGVNDAPAVLVTPATEKKRSREEEDDDDNDDDHDKKMTAYLPSGVHANDDDDGDNDDDRGRRLGPRSPRRVLFATRSSKSVIAEVPVAGGTIPVDQVPVTPSPSFSLTNKKKRPILSSEDDVSIATAAAAAPVGSGTTTTTQQPSAKRRLLFGRYVNLIECSSNVEIVYKIVRKLTGNIGGNGYSGPIYGELTMHSMQKMINLMMKTTGLCTSSRFLDVGSGIGKPNLHVAQYPGVAFSCGVEMEKTRWHLGMTCLKACLDAAVKDQEEGVLDDATLVKGNTMFLHKNILEAKTFDPFTHVYMFSIGFPPELWHELSDQWNKSDPRICQYLICYHGPRDIIDNYEFKVELVAQTSTSMHGSKEGHMGYVYRRTSETVASSTCTPTGDWRNVVDIPCDPLFRPSFQLIQDGLKPLHEEVTRQVQELMGGTRRTTRSRQQDKLTR